jgi:regulator of protease activity HflC (stomatin/prohibitin superfamily)
MEAILVVLILAFGLFAFFSSVRVLPEYDRLVVLRLGRYTGTRGPGLTLLIPFIETARKVDLRERFLEIPRQTAISKDNTAIDVDFLVYYRVVQPKLAVLEIENVVQASLNIAATTLRAVIGDIDLDDVLAKREQINDVLRVKLDEVTERWGLKVTRVEIREVEPPASVREAMNRQMSAERERRATVTRAEGERASAIMVAEGEKQASVLRAEGEKQSQILRAEGERQAQLLVQQGRAAGLQALISQARLMDERTLMLQYLDTLSAIGASPATKYVLPMELTAMAQRFVGVMNTAGDGGGPAPAGLPPAPDAPPPVDDVTEPLGRRPQA